MSKDVAGRVVASPLRHTVRETGPVIYRAVKVLDAFTPDRRSQTLSELARRTSLPLTTVHRLVNDLIVVGLLERDAEGRYHIGIRMWEIASLAPHGVGLRQVAFPFMEDLFHVIHENVQLAVREGHDAVFIERLTDRSALRVDNRVGGRFEMPPTGVGRVLLAYAPNDVQEEVLAEPLRQYTSQTVTSPMQMRQILAQVRKCGYAVTVGQLRPNATSVAAPVYGADGVVVAALGVVVHSEQAARTSLVPLVQAAARGISRSLGVG